MLDELALAPPVAIRSHCCSPGALGPLPRQG